MQLVQPPNGIKHQLLQQATKTEIVEGMKSSIQKMILSGTYCFCDFREGGIKGVDLLTRAVKHFNLNTMIFSRPQKMNFNKNELRELFEGISPI